MSTLDAARFRKLLEDRRSELAMLSASSAETRKPVELDQQSIGRLTRQDALQQQAMANAQEVRRGVELKKINLALKRVDEEEFGWCTECGEEISVKRLELDPTAVRCAPCAGAVKR